MTLLFADETRSAVISPCRRYRYRLEREVSANGLAFAYFGINGSKADATIDDQTTKKWIGFTRRNGGRKYIVGNPFAFRSQDVRLLADVGDPVGPENAQHLAGIIRDADILVPCWGSRNKIPERLHPQLDALRDLIFASGKPVRVFGFTASGDPKHPLMLGYDTALVNWDGMTSVNN